VSAADNRKAAEELFARLSAGDVPGALATMTDDATWLAAGRRELLPAAGSYSKEKLARLFNAMLGQLKNGLKMTVKSMIAEGDRVALEAESYGELKNGRVYNQHYSFVIEFRGGKICAVREYLDTQHAHAVWYEGVERSRAR
jgi:ketosteroid isomerase-like protein